MRRYGVEETRNIDVKTRRSFAWGDKIHDFAKSVYYHAGIVVADELGIHDAALDVSARVDVVVGGPPQSTRMIPRRLALQWSPEWLDFLGEHRVRLLGTVPAQDWDEIVGVEIKSAKSYAMQKMKKEGPKKGHVRQLATEWLIYQRSPEQFPCEITKWRLEYVGKDAVGVLTYGITERDVEDVQARIDFLNAAWKAQAHPTEVPCECEGWMVDYCAYATAKGKCCDVYTLGDPPPGKEDLPLEVGIGVREVKAGERTLSVIEGGGA